VSGIVSQDRLLPIWALPVAAGGGIAIGAAGLIAVAVSFAAVLLFALFCRLRLGGGTGDVLGASCELAELAMLLSLAAGR